MQQLQQQESVCYETLLTIIVMGIRTSLLQAHIVQQLIQDMVIPAQSVVLQICYLLHGLETD